jgi:alpha-amylase
MKSIHLVFGTYNDHPVGSDGERFEKNYQQALKPFLSILNRFPKFPAVLFYSGILLEWIEKNHPEFIMLLTEMVKRKQVELLTGGFYEPVLPMIPNSDKVGQIEMLTTYLRTRFGKRPRGSWLTERIWDPSLASTLRTSGIDYTFLVDRHFQHAGLEEEELYYTYVTEDQGKTISIFPLSDTLGDYIPGSPPEEVLAFMTSHADSAEDRIISLIVDGGNLASRDSRTRSSSKSWLEAFLNLIDDRSDIVVPISPEQYLKQIAPRRKIYFPTTRYSEMTRWLSNPRGKGKATDIMKRTKTSSDLRQCYSAGLFRHFLTRYPESNLMYAKMMYVHLLVNGIRGDKYRKKTAREELWRGQYHGAYWHGRGGGIYLNALRKSIYRSFIEVEDLTRLPGVFTPSIISFDFDMDGQNEHLYQSKELNAYIHSNGASIFELDYIPKRWNYQDTLARRPELYHGAEAGAYDWYMRKAFVDHFFSEGDSIESFNTMSYKELGDFVLGSYELMTTNRDHFEIDLYRNGYHSSRSRSNAIRIDKKYSFKKATVSVDYTITNSSNHTLSLRFGSEVNLAFASDASKDLKLFKFDSSGKRTSMTNGMTSHNSVSRVMCQDQLNKTNIDLSSEHAFALWSLPVETAVLSNGTKKRVYQSTCLVPQWKFELRPNEHWNSTLSLSFSMRETKRSRKT